jgi:hypothetical protein
LAGCENCFKLDDKSGQVGRQDLPEDVHVHRAIAMNQTISQAHDLWLGDARILCLQLLGNAAGRLTDDLKQASQDQVENSLAIQIGASCPERG